MVETGRRPCPSTEAKISSCSGKAWWVKPSGESKDRKLCRGPKASVILVTAEFTEIQVVEKGHVFLYSFGFHCACRGPTSLLGVFDRTYDGKVNESRALHPFQKGTSFWANSKSKDQATCIKKSPTKFHAMVVLVSLTFTDRFRERNTIKPFASLFLVAMASNLIAMASTEHSVLPANPLPPTF